eukprot:1491769-Prymnesium_polylepis.1
MADSEHDETFEDAEGSEDEQPKKTRKTAGGRVIIRSTRRANPTRTCMSSTACYRAATQSTRTCCATSSRPW